MLDYMTVRTPPMCGQTAQILVDWVRSRVGAAGEVLANTQRRWAGGLTLTKVRIIHHSVRCDAAHLQQSVNAVGVISVSG